MSEPISTEISSGNIRLFAKERVYSNPWQPRITKNLAHINALAADIKDKGLLQKPIGRLHPQDAECTQLAFGHNRFDAWQIAFPVEPFPVEIRDLTDRQMSDFAAAENGQRDDLKVIEKARAIKKRMDDFQLPQLEAGQSFGYAVQGSVGNLLSLLELPEPIQVLIGDGGLPQRHARGLIKLGKVLPELAQEIAAQVAAAENKDETFEREFEDALREHGQHMYSAPFKENTVLPITHVLKAAAEILGEIKNLPTCKGCAFYIKNDRNERAATCMRPACYKLKCQAAAWQEVENVGKKFKIELLKEGEKAQLIFNGSHHSQEPIAAKAIAAKHESLRVAPANDDLHSWSRKRILGAEHVELHTTNLAELKKAIAKLPAEKKKAAVERAQSDSSRGQKKQRERRDECRRLLRAAAVHVAKAFDYSDAVLDTMILAMANHHFSDNSTQLGKRAKSADAAGKAQIVGEIMLAMATRAGSMYADVTPAATLKKIEALAAALKVKLPKGWEVKE